MRHGLLILAFFVAPLQPVRAAVNFTKEKGSSQFLAIGNPSAIRIEGKGDGPEGNLQAKEDGKSVVISGALKVDMKSYGTGISLRDRHMKEKYLEVEKFQTATLNLKDIHLAKEDLQKNPETKATFFAVLDLHGVQKPVQGEVVLKPSTNGGYTVNAKFPLKLSDFSISVPAFAGITVADQVEITTTTEVEKF
jgi:polyisoprenoid-binding protein YceI